MAPDVTFVWGVEVDPVALGSALEAYQRNKILGKMFRSAAEGTTNAISELPEEMIQEILGVVGQLEEEKRMKRWQQIGEHQSRAYTLNEHPYTMQLLTRRTFCSLHFMNAR